MNDRITNILTRLDRSFASWRSVVLLVGLVAAARLVYLAFLCPYTLVEDEAWYWEWSRRLEWSYYSKGPGVAWAIAASSWLFAKLGIPISEFTVRFPSVVSLAVLMLAAAALARRATGEPRAGFYAAALIVLAPVFQIGGMLMTIDMPYAACWALACLCGWMAMREGSRTAWLGLGAALAAGFLFKYTILLLVPGLALFVLLQRGRLKLPRGWPIWAAGGLALFLLGLIPVVIWNAQHDWVTIRHLLGHLGVEGGDVAPTQGVKGWRYSPKWTLELIGTQLSLVGPAIVLCAWAMIDSFRKRATEPDAWPGRLYLILCAAPIMAFYFGVSFITEVEGNWPLAGWISLLTLAGWTVTVVNDDLRQRIARWRAITPNQRPWAGVIRRRPETFTHLAWRFAVILGLLVALFTLRADLIAKAPPMRWLEARLQNRGMISPGRPLIPLGRLMGAREMALDAERLRQGLSDQTGKEAFAIAQQYGRAALLAFYMPGRPTVYCSSAHSPYGRRTQYDLWPQTSLSKPDLSGRPAVLVGGTLEDWSAAFEEVRVHGPLAAEPKLDRNTQQPRPSFLGIGYRGFAHQGGGAR